MIISLDYLTQIRQLDLSETIIAVDFDGTCVFHDFPAVVRVIVIPDGDTRAS